MSITELRDQQKNLRADLTRVINDGLALSRNPNADVNAMTANLAEADRIRAQIQLTDSAIRDAEGAHAPAQAPAPAENRTLNDILASREYHRAFRAAMRGNWKPGMEVVNDQQRLLLNLKQHSHRQQHPHHLAV